jgi:hypothetical protein
MANGKDIFRQWPPRAAVKGMRDNRYGRSVVPMTALGGQQRTSLMEKHVLVIDIPPDATAAEVEQLLNEPYERGFYLFRMISRWPTSIDTQRFEGTRGVGWLGERAFFRLRAHPEKE